MKKLKAVYQKMKEIFFRRLLKLEWPELYYINGPETLPPPLSREEEDEVMERVRRGGSDIHRNHRLDQGG